MTKTTGDVLFTFGVLFFIGAVIIFGLKTVQLNKLPDGNPSHLLAGRILWVVGTIAFIAAIVLLIV